MRLEELDKKYTKGPQKMLIEAMINKEYDIILKAGKQTGKSTGYLIPMVNEAIKRERKNDNRRCVGLIITWSSEMVKDITKLANEMCLRFPISVISGQKRSLNVEIENGYYIIITKAVLLFNNLLTMEQSFKGLKYIVIEQASCFASVDKNRTLMEILNKVRSKGTSNITTILSCIDFRGTENKLQTQFLEKESTCISLIGLTKEEKVISELRVDDGKKNTINNDFFKRIPELGLELFFTNHIDTVSCIQNLITRILSKNNRNIVIYFTTAISSSIVKYKLSSLGIPFKVSNDNVSESRQNFRGTFGNVLICSDNLEEELIDTLKKKVVIHYFLPQTKEAFKKRIEIQKKSGEYLKSIIFDDKTRLENFLKEGDIMS
uniref:ATP-dependent RNA helicase n=1 Tax=Strongyloides papillosus TaxID=174720 RepID=A0A0N5BIE8_STREA